MNNPNSQPTVAPSASIPKPPSITVTKINDGFMINSNLTDETLMLGLLEEGKFVIRLKHLEQKSKLVKSSGMNGLLAKMRKP